ncbi:MAG: hypothetical protein ACTHKP_09875 [Nitrososphaeraceae archaeon]
MTLIQTQISILQAIVYFVAAAVPIYLFFILKRHDNSYNNHHFRNLLIVLAGFVLVQGIYHFVGAVGFNMLAKGILEPISFVILLLFGIIYFVTNGSIVKKRDVKAQ